MAAAYQVPTLLISPKPYQISPKTNPRSHSIRSCSNKSKPATKCPVPYDQQPVNEYNNLSTSFPFSWASANIRDYRTRLTLLGSSFAILLGLPVASFDPPADALRCCLGSSVAGILSVVLLVLRMYLGWSYVGNRLLSATVEYEETGWYDGQIWVKTSEVLTRDRLLGSFSVKPVLSRLKSTLIGLAISLSVCVIIFIHVENPMKIPPDNKTGEKVIAGVYNDEAARLFEPDAFCGEPDLWVP